MIDVDDIEIQVAGEEHVQYVDEILDTIARAAKVRGTGIAKRSPEYVKQKMIEHKAVVALYHGNFAGFSYIESWSNKMFVANSGLIVSDAFRGIGLAKRIKKRIFELMGICFGHTVNLAHFFRKQLHFFLLFLRIRAVFFFFTGLRVPSGAMHRWNSPLHFSISVMTLRTTAAPFVLSTGMHPNLRSSAPSVIRLCRSQSVCWTTVSFEKVAISSMTSSPNNSQDVFIPFNLQEQVDKLFFIKCLNTFEDVLTRENQICHICSSAFIVNKQRTKVLCAHHNIFGSWGWVGGHIDGVNDLEYVAEKENGKSE